MNILRTVLVILIFVIVSPAQDDSFLQTVIENEGCVTCYFLSFGVESKAYTGRVVIDNHDFSLFVKSTQNLDSNGYKNFARELLTSNRRLDLNPYAVRVNVKTALYIDKIAENTFLIVPEIPEFEAIASKGCVEFVNEFFIENAGPAKTGERDKTDCRKFILSQNEDLSSNRRLSALEQNFVINKLFLWQIPVVNDHNSGLTIRRYSLNPKKSTPDKK